MSLTGPRRGAPWWLIAVVGAAGLLLGGVIGAMSNTATAATPTALSSPSPVLASYPVIVYREPTAAAPTTPAPKTTKATPYFEDGTWTVGVDIPAGTYRPREAADTDCYWEIDKGGTNGEEILANGRGGGRPTITLKKGQDLTVEHCGIWVKVG